MNARFHNPERARAVGLHQEILRELRDMKRCSDGLRRSANQRILEISQYLGRRHATIRRMEWQRVRDNVAPNVTSQRTFVRIVVESIASFSVPKRAQRSAISNCLDRTGRDAHPDSHLIAQRPRAA